jgi:hypothetical protein
MTWEWQIFKEKEMLLKRILLVFVLAGFLPAGNGCAPSFVSSDAGVYSTTKLYAVTKGDITSVYEATLAALEKLEIEVTDKAKDVFYAKVVAKGADGKSIVVRIEPGSGDIINYNIKVGAFGDEHRSRMIYEQIQKNLGGGRK